LKYRKVAILGKKRAIFHIICALNDPTNPKGMNSLYDSKNDLSQKDFDEILKIHDLIADYRLQANNFKIKMVFELIASKSITISSAYVYPVFTVKFYAIKHFIIDQHYINFDFE
jgi:hypothetical protein